MKLTLALATSMLALTVSSAHADVLKGRCDGTKCDAFEFAEKSIVKTKSEAQEVLAFTRVKTWVQDGDKRTDEGEDWGYIFCSKGRPAMIVQNDKKFSVMFLAPQIVDEYEKRLNFYIMYFEACHSRGSEVISKRSDLAKELDYEVKRTQVSELKSIRKPESLFWWPGAKVVAASKRSIHPFVIEEIKPTQVAKPTQPAKPPEPTKPVLFTKPVVAEMPEPDEARPIVGAAKPDEVKSVPEAAKQDHVAGAATTDEPKTGEAAKAEEPKPVLEGAKPGRPKIDRRSRVQSIRRRPPQRQFQNRYADRPYPEERRRDAFESPLGDDAGDYRPPSGRYGETFVERRRFRREADAERPHYNAAPVERRGPPPFWSFDSW